MSELDIQNKDRQPEQDPIARLHKMSTTAGVAAQDYVAINTLAVTTAVLGVATSLAFLETYFLVIGLAAIACGIMALRKIGDSNGTEGGKALAWAGVLIAVGLAGAIAFNALAKERAQEAERGRIREAISQVGKSIAAGDYDKAYQFFDPSFKQLWKPSQFQGVWQLWQDPDPNRGYGHLAEIVDNGIISFPTASADRPIAWTKLLLHFQNRAERRVSTEFVKGEDGQWRISLLNEMFQEPRGR